MRKRLLFFSIIFVFLLFPLCVRSESCSENSIKLLEATLDSKSADTIEQTEVNIDNNKLVVDVAFREVDDYIKYKLLLYNDTDEDYDLRKSIPSSDGVISYILESCDDSVSIKAGENKEVYLIIKYTNRVNKSNFNEGIYVNSDNIKITFSNVIDVPDTGKSVSKITILAMVVLLLLSIVIIKRSRKLHLELFIFAIILIPSIVRAACICTINIVPNITITEFEQRNLINVVKEEVPIDDEDSEFITSNTGINYLYPSSNSNGKGKYILANTKNEENPIVYYRGNVSDNNVLYANYCWKILRTTENNGLKLIYNGTPTTDNKCLGENSILASNIKYNNSQSNLTSFGYMISSGHAIQNAKKISSIANGSKFSNDISFSDGVYTLSGDVISKESTFSAEQLNHHHYTCFGSDTCQNVSFVFMERGGYIWYINLSGGEKIEDVIEKDIVNQNYENDSNVKAFIDDWFANNLLDYVDDLEDTVWCNDKSIYTKGGWDKDGDVSAKLTFNANYRTMSSGKPSLECSNPNDRFTVSTENGNGKLTYPVGLITLDEGILSGFSWLDGFAEDDNNYIYDEKPWWTMSPSLQSANYMYEGVLYAFADNVTVVYVNGNSGGVKPSIVLKSEKKIASGDGTKDNPFTIVAN